MIGRLWRNTKAISSIYSVPIGQLWRVIATFALDNSMTGQQEDFMHSNFPIDISLQWIDAAFT
jgi:hypothetical protein